MRKFWIPAVIITFFLVLGRYLGEVVCHETILFPGTNWMVEYLRQERPEWFRVGQYECEHTELAVDSICNSAKKCCLVVFSIHILLPTAAFLKCEHVNTKCYSYIFLFFFFLFWFWLYIYWSQWDFCDWIGCSEAFLVLWVFLFVCF